jgi:hypothetical protein
MTTIRCECGQVEMAASGKPILCVSCYCESCRTAGLAFERAGAEPLVQDDGGTPYVVYRKDRIAVRQGEQLLEEHRLDPASFTRRVTAGCCGTPMYADFTKGFWLTVYRNRLAAPPPVAMRVMTADRTDETPLPDDLPNYRGHSGKFLLKLLATWVAMGFRTPRFPPATP